MGTNYYIKRKTVFDKNIDIPYHRKEKEVTILNNGYVYDNNYYPDIESLNKDYYQYLHIGKSSCGWHFALCIYPTLGINNIDDWRREFNNSDNIIENEYGEIITPEEMMDDIVNRVQPAYLHYNQEKYEETVLLAANEIKAQYFKEEKPFETFEEYLNANNAERGLNGLLAHRSGSTFMLFQRTDGTYDLTTEVNFS